MCNIRLGGHHRGLWLHGTRGRLRRELRGDRRARDGCRHAPIHGTDQGGGDTRPVPHLPCGRSLPPEVRARLGRERRAVTLRRLSTHPLRHIRPLRHTHPRRSGNGEHPPRARHQDRLDYRIHRRHDGHCAARSGRPRLPGRQLRHVRPSACRSPRPLYGVPEHDKPRHPLRGQRGEGGRHHGRHRRRHPLQSMDRGRYPGQQ